MRCSSDVEHCVIEKMRYSRCALILCDNIVSGDDYRTEIRSMDLISKITLSPAHIIDAYVYTARVLMIESRDLQMTIENSDLGCICIQTRES